MPNVVLPVRRDLDPTNRQLGCLAPSAMAGFVLLLRLAGLPLRCSSIPVTGALGDGGNGWMLSFPLVR